MKLEDELSKYAKGGLVFSLDLFKLESVMISKELSLPKIFIRSEGNVEVNQNDAVTLCMNSPVLI